MHPEAITSKQNEILKKLPIPPDFYLAGGTALALQIGHRISVGRAAWKDYIDLYFILKEKHLELQELIDIAQKKYGEEFDARLFLEQLLYSEDVPPAPITFLKEEPIRDGMLTFFEQTIKQIKI